MLSEDMIEIKIPEVTLNLSNMLNQLIKQGSIEQEKRYTSTQVIDIIKSVLDLQASFALEKDKGEATKSQIWKKIVQEFTNPKIQATKELMEKTFIVLNDKVSSLRKNIDKSFTPKTLDIEKISQPVN